jgi:hypothetical protein
VIDWTTVSALATGGGTLVLARPRSHPGDLRGEEYERAREAIKNRETLTIDLQYGDNEGGQRIITRFILRPGEDGFLIPLGHPPLERGPARPEVGRVDRPGPR